MPKNIVVLSDGTGQNGGKGHDTNVYKLFRMLEDRTENQVVFYDQGIGTDTQIVSGSVFGAGFDKNILQCYRFIFEHYQSGDKIFLFGFSRGAATVRSLASFIHYFGILPASRPELIAQAYQIYMNRQSSSDKKDLPPLEYNPLKLLNRLIHHWNRARCYDLDDEEEGESAKFVRLHPNQWVQVEFLGVWDTVPALGLVVSDVLDALLNLVPALKHNYHNFQLRKSVKHACHALSIDDQRKWFWPTVWKETQEENERKKKIEELVQLKKKVEANIDLPQNNRRMELLKKQILTESEQKVEQVWFGGSHTDVGGGFREAGFSDTALEWMVQKAFEHGLKLYFGSRKYWNFCLAPDATDEFHDPRAGIGKIYARGERNEIWKDALRTFGPPRVHISVLQRAKDYPGKTQKLDGEEMKYDPWILKSDFNTMIAHLLDHAADAKLSLKDVLYWDSGRLNDWLAPKPGMLGLSEIKLSEYEIWCLSEKYRRDYETWRSSEQELSDYDDWLYERYLSDATQKYQDWRQKDQSVEKQQDLPSLETWMALPENSYEAWKRSAACWVALNIEHLNSRTFLVERPRRIVYDPDGNALVLYEQDKQQLEKQKPGINVLAFRDYDKDTLKRITGESYESFQKRAQRRAAKKRQSFLARQKAQAEQQRRLAELYRIDWDIERWNLDRSQLFIDDSNADSVPLQNPTSREADQTQPEGRE